jgi:hypothetical protein
MQRRIERPESDLQRPCDTCRFRLVIAIRLTARATPQLRATGRTARDDRQRRLRAARPSRPAHHETDRQRIARNLRRPAVGYPPGCRRQYRRGDEPLESAGAVVTLVHAR